MRKFKLVAGVVIIVWVAIAVAVQFLRQTPEQKLVAEYGPRFEEQRERIEDALEALPDGRVEPSADEAKLAALKDVRVVLVDAEAVASPAAVAKERVDDPFAARLHHWEPEESKEDAMPDAWPIGLEELTKAYDRFLDDGVNYVAVLRAAEWTDPVEGEESITAGVVDLDFFLLDVENAEVLGSGQFSYDQSAERIVLFDRLRNDGAESQAKHNLRSRVHEAFHGWVSSLFDEEQNVRIGSLRYDILADGLVEPEAPR